MFLISVEKYQGLRKSCSCQKKTKKHVWVLTGPVSDLLTENYQNGDLVPVRGQEFPLYSVTAPYTAYRYPIILSRKLLS
jgi:hypothetical protein